MLIIKSFFLFPSIMMQQKELVFGRKHNNVIIMHPKSFIYHCLSLSVTAQKSCSAIKQLHVANIHVTFDGPILNMSVLCVYIAFPWHKKRFCGVPFERKPQAFVLVWKVKQTHILCLEVWGKWHRGLTSICHSISLSRRERGPVPPHTQ